MSTERQIRRLQRVAGSISQSASASSHGVAEPVAVGTIRTICSWARVKTELRKTTRAGWRIVHMRRTIGDSESRWVGSPLVGFTKHACLKGALDRHVQGCLGARTDAER